MSYRKTSVPLMQSGGTPFTIHKSLKMRTANRSEFDDSLVRHNQRQGNRLSLELEQWDKAQRVVTKGMDKDTQWFRQKTQVSNNGVTPTKPGKRHSFSYGIGSVGGDGQGAKLIPDYQYTSKPHSPTAASGADYGGGGGGKKASHTSTNALDTHPAHSSVDGKTKHSDLSKPRTDSDKKRSESHGDSSLRQKSSSRSSRDKEARPSDEKDDEKDDEKQRK